MKAIIAGASDEQIVAVVTQQPVLLRRTDKHIALFIAEFRLALLKVISPASLPSGGCGVCLKHRIGSRRRLIVEVFPKRPRSPDA